MLLLADGYNNLHSLMLADSHTHLRVGSLEGVTASEMLIRSYQMLKGVISDMKKHPETFRYRFPGELKERSFNTREFCFRNFLGLAKPPQVLKESISEHLGVDFFSTFPSDIAVEGTRDYRTANIQMKDALSERLEGGLPHNNPRFFPYGRVDPNHPDAIDTVDTVHMLGLRGLKLHPKEERFDIASPRTVRILYRCAEHDIPVIFHTQDGSTNALLSVVKETISEMVGRGETRLLPRLKVVAGHAPWNGADSPDLFRVLTHPNIFGDLSTLKGTDMPRFFKNAKERIRYMDAFSPEMFPEGRGDDVVRSYFNRFRYNQQTYWSSKLMFGSDTPYPPSNSSRALVSFILSKEFPGDISDVQNILGASLLRIIPVIPVLQPASRSCYISYAERFHSGMFARMLETHSRLISVEPIIENFPMVRVNGAVVTFYSGGTYRRWMFTSLFDPARPRYIVREYAGYDDMCPSRSLDGLSSAPGGGQETKK